MTADYEGIIEENIQDVADTAMDEFLSACFLSSAYDEIVEQAFDEAIREIEEESDYKVFTWDDGGPSYQELRDQVRDAIQNYLTLEMFALLVAEQVVNQLGHMVVPRRVW